MAVPYRAMAPWPYSPNRYFQQKRIMAIIVKKFGGTSVGNGERLKNVASIIESTLRDYRVVVVVSAMSDTVKSEGTTSRLLRAAEQALAGESFSDTLKAIERHHQEAIDVAVETAALREEAASDVRQEMDRLRGVLEAIEVLRDMSPRSQDVLLSTGERLSALLLAATLRSRGIEAKYTDLTDIVPDSEAEVDPRFFQRLQEPLANRCRPTGSLVPVVTGFFGMVPGGLLAAVGRGYTDFTAAMISAGLGNQVVHEMQVWKEVDGIFTADPRRVKNATVLPSITPSEAAELTYFGSEVLHPFTMERVVSAHIPIRVKNTFSPKGDGTVIYTQENPPHRVTAVTAKRGITIISVQSNRMYNAHGFMARVFNVLESKGVVVDLISTSEVSISLTVDSMEDAKRAKAGLEELGSVTISPGRSILAMVGEGMKYYTGTAGKMFTALGDSKVNIEMITQGASEINISCVIAEEDTENALLAVHKAFMDESNGAHKA